MSLLTRVLLACYPREVRDRYGEEIADLLKNSTTPWRDSVDVLRSGLTERVTNAGLAKVLAPLAFVGIVVLWFKFPEAYPQTVMLVLISIAVLAGLWLGERPRKSWHQHPLAALACFGLIWFLPVSGDLVARVLGYTIWLAGAWMLVRLVYLRRRRSRLTLALAMAAGLAMLELATVAWIAYQQRDLALTADAWAWLPKMFFGYDISLGGIDMDPAARLALTPFHVPLLAPTLAFAVAYAHRAGALTARRTL
ncbi:MAG TPA: hypothetical protein DGG94_14455 [Micromonosporaceae bacterium]|nr:hypothetical protein [Micromonosporaceae bacterium]HCU50975.1 hypothetical protein [Micromonosporaceae bacterium]